MYIVGMYVQRVGMYKVGMYNTKSWYVCIQSWYVYRVGMYIELVWFCFKPATLPLPVKGVLATN